MIAAIEVTRAYSFTLSEENTGGFVIALHLGSIVFEFFLTKKERDGKYNRN